MIDVFILKGRTAEIQIEKDGSRYCVDTVQPAQIEDMVITVRGDVMCIGAKSRVNGFTVMIPGDVTGLEWGLCDPVSAVKGNYDLEPLCSDRIRLTRNENGFEAQMMVSEAPMGESTEEYTDEDFIGDREADIAMLSSYGAVSLSESIRQAASREELVQLEAQMWEVIGRAYGDVIRHRSE